MLIFLFSFVAETVDVNVTPDKRLIMIENENLLLAIIKVACSLYDF